MMELIVPNDTRIEVPFSLGVFEDCTLVITVAELGWDAVIVYPEKLSIRNEYPYIIPPETLHSTQNETALLFYPSSDMLGGYYDGEPTAALEVHIRKRDDDTLTVVLDLNEHIEWMSDVD